MQSEDEPVMVVLDSMDVGSLRLDARRFARKPILASLFGIASPAVGVRDSGDDSDSITLLDEDASGAYPEMVAGGHYLVLAPDQMRDDSEPEPPMTRERYVEWMIKQRTRVADVQRERRALIERHYTRVHPSLWQLDRTLLDARFVALAARADTLTRDDVLAFVRAEGSVGVYSFPLFAPALCRMMLDEVEHFSRSGLPSSRPNSMNNYGVILDDLGLSPMLAELRTSLLIPAIARHLYAEHGGATLDGHHAFVVQYSMDTERDLGFHYDASDVTLNVCLGHEFTGGELFFRGRLDEPSTHDEDLNYAHVVGRAVMHIGKHRHGARALTSGRRANLIVWMRSSELAAAHHAHSHEHGGACAHHVTKDDDDDDDVDVEGEPVVELPSAHSHNHAHGGCGGGGAGGDDDEPTYTAVVEEVEPVQFQVIGGAESEE